MASFDEIASLEEIANLDEMTSIELKNYTEGQQHLKWINQ